MTMSIDALKAAWGKSDNNNSSGPSNYYPFWNMQIGESATIRFLPDANANNPLGFMVEKVMHVLDIAGERKSVPCMSMYDTPCPICAVSQSYYKDDDKINGKKYWKKKQYIAQALIQADPLPLLKDEEPREGTVKFVSINYSIYKIIKDTFESGELDEIPYAYEGGTDFIIKKDQQGEYASYVLSKFARKSTDIDDDLTLTDLSTLLPKNPGIDKVEGMLEASLSGEAYEDSSQTSQTIKPTIEEEVATKLKSADSVEAKTKPEVETKVDDAQDDVDQDVDDLLAEIRNRRAKKAG